MELDKVYLVCPNCGATCLASHFSIRDGWLLAFAACPCGANWVFERGGKDKNEYVKYLRLAPSIALMACPDCYNMHHVEMYELEYDPFGSHLTLMVRCTCGAGFAEHSVLTRAGL